MFKVIKNIWEAFWGLFIIATMFVCAKDIYRDVQKAALKRQARGLPPIMKFNDHLFDRTSKYK